MKEILKHETYATVEFSRVQSTYPKHLFGSNVPCTTIIKLTIKPAEIERTAFNERVCASTEDTYIEVEMTPNQFSELITHFNTEPGIPCTLIQKDGKMYKQEPFKSRLNSIRESFAARLEARFNKTIEDAKKMASWCKGKPNKSQLHEMQMGFESMIMEYQSNIPYFMQCLEETMSKLSTEAKSEFENWMVKRITDVGIDALRKTSTQLEEKDINVPINRIE